MSKILLALLSLVASLLLAEVVLRIVGFEPWSYQTLDLNEPVMNRPDTELGWISKAGSYRIPPYVPEGSEIRLSFPDDGRRNTGKPASATGRKLVFIGGSFTMGAAVSDAETFPSKVQETFPDLEVINYGVSGYGSYQSLLLLEQKLPDLNSVDLVLYGFILHHEARNVAPGNWLRLLSSFSRRGHVALPYATVDENGQLVRHPPETYVTFPLREYSALSTFLERAYMRLKTWRRLTQRRAVTEQVILNMRETTAKHGARFAVVFLDTDQETKEHYIDFAAKNNIEQMDCARGIPDSMRVPGDGHPNGEMHTVWAECIAEKLRGSTDRTGTL